MSRRFLLNIFFVVAILNIIAWALSTPPAKTYPTALDFGSGIITIGR